MSSILSEQNLQTLRRRNIGRRWPSFPCAAPAAPVRPRPPPPLLLPPPPKLLRPPFIASPPGQGRSRRRGRHPARHAALHQVADPPAGRAPRAGEIGRASCRERVEIAVVA